VKHRSAALPALLALSLVPAFAIVPLACGGDDTQVNSGEMPDGSSTDGDNTPTDATVDHVTHEASPGDATPDRTQDVVEEPIVDAGHDATTDASDAGNCTIDSTSGEPTDLRCTGLYSDWATKTVDPANVEYDPGLRLWSDGAVKSRWIWLPPGTQIDTSNMDEWIFPVGTKFWKQFVVNGQFVETRLLHKQAASGWAMVTYRWSSDLSKATIEPPGQDGGVLNVNDAGYEIPSRDKCIQCHQGRIDSVLGFEAVSLASPQASGYRMSDLVSQGLVTNAPAGSLDVPGDAVEAAALGYLHANCGTTCHNSNRGLAHTTGFYMRLDVAKLGSVMATDTYTTGWGKSTVTSQFAGQGVTKRLVACSPTTSCVYYRASHRDGINAPTGTQMPPIDTHAVDPNGLATIAAWINEGCAADSGTDQ
jgi:hypothetical protein